MTKYRRAPHHFITWCVEERGFETIPDARMGWSFVWPEISMRLCTADIMRLSTEAGNSTEE